MPLRSDAEENEERSVRLHREAFSKQLQDRADDHASRTREIIAALTMAGVAFDQVTAQVLHDMGVMLMSFSDSEEG